MQHTWQIRTASTSCVSPLQTSNLKQLEDDLTAFVRRMQTTKTSDSTNGVDHELQVVLSWIQLTQQSSGTSSCGDDQHSSSSSSETNNDASVVSTTPASLFLDDNHRHFNIEVHDRGSTNNHASTTTSVKAQVMLCFCETSARQDIVVMNAFAFIMVQGANPMIQLLVRWLESRTGVIISQRPFGFTPSQVAQCVTSWTVLSLQQHHQMLLREQQLQHDKQQQQGSVVEDYEEDDMICATTTTTANTTLSSSQSKTSHSGKRRRTPKPLDLTFAMPEVVANKGLDTISLSIQPADLLKLYRDIEDRRPCHPTKAGQDERLEANSDPPTPLLRALQCYMVEVFHIDIRSFPLIRASSSAAMLSCDGRCKVHDESFLPLVLYDVKVLVQKRFAKTSSALPNSNNAIKR